MEPDFNAIEVEATVGPDGQLLAGVDDLLVLLKRNARAWFGEDAAFLKKFDHVVEGAFQHLKDRRAKERGN
jgi:hypothetical protein